MQIDRKIQTYNKRFGRLIKKIIYDLFKQNKKETMAVFLSGRAQTTQTQRHR